MKKKMHESTEFKSNKNNYIFFCNIYINIYRKRENYIFHSIAQKYTKNIKVIIIKQCLM